MTPEIKAAYDKFTQAGRELFLVLNITPAEKEQAALELADEKAQDFVDDDIFLAGYVYDSRECCEDADGI